ncbi:glycine cleavage system protein H [Candidatus Formimonas warabiya]|uniref:Glycine cleavage system H protein n=1 Tax=Formimonas warabiya TaxID=1761012 RepID=A0A3G1KTP1_FORW1|nr:glycine cleavage system H protein [Candidatus Formimonas warabiya]ATW25873.1 hypothetical protein DCMF_14820 [Candidatus Formimonas warabiya]
MHIEGYHFPDDLKYDRSHFWEKVEGDQVTLGMTDFAVRLAGEFVFADVVEPGKKVHKDQVFMSVESGKWVGRVMAPVDGEITAYNEDLEFEPERINEDPYGKGWLVKIKVYDPSQLAALMDVGMIEPWLKEEIKRVKGE